MASLFERYAPYRQVFVVGCQRSDTDLVARCIARDAKMPYFGEENYNGDDEELFIKSIKKHGVFDAPGITHNIHHYSTDNRLILYVFRSAREIEQSFHIDPWEGYSKEMDKYKDYPGTLAMRKYTKWATEQRSIVDHYAEFQYIFLKTHDLYKLNHAKA
jgi:hypothetical protein